VLEPAEARQLLDSIDVHDGCSDSPALPSAQDEKSAKQDARGDVWPELRVRAAACYQAASPALARLLRDDLRRGPALGGGVSRPRRSRTT
jgi:hypothetical protein